MRNKLNTPRRIQKIFDVSSDLVGEGVIRPLEARERDDFLAVEMRSISARKVPERKRSISHRSLR